MTKKDTKNILIIGIIGIILLGIIAIAYMYNKKSSSQTDTDKKQNVSSITKISNPTLEPSSEMKNVLYKINQATEELKNVPNQIKSTYGKMDRFYVTGKASLPESGLTLIKTIEKVTSIKDVLNENMPIDATFFAYDPIKSTVSYYKGDVSLSLIKPGEMTIGSILP